jgi:hypothetical protein
MRTQVTWVTDRLPLPGQKIWVTLREDGVEPSGVIAPRAVVLARWTGKILWSLSGHQIRTNDVMAWMPLSYPSPHYDEDMDWQDTPYRFSTEDSMRSETLTIIADERADETI